MTAPVAVDRFAAAKAVADAVLYEGYVLYPYRASSAKNQMRWQFGVLCPKAFSDADPSERWRMRTECLVDPGPHVVLSVRVRFLQAQHRRVEAADGRGGFVPVERLDVDGAIHVAWDEAVDQVVDLAPLALPPSGGVARDDEFSCLGGSEVELILSADGSVAGRIVRERIPVEGRVRIVTHRPDPGRWVKVAAAVANATRWAPGGATRSDVIGASLLALHAMIGVEDGSFVSLLDPPPDAGEAVAACRNDGWFPVLIGSGDVVLAAPIILYDHPEVAPESPGDLYDATEIDEILALRVLTLTDEEKAEARATDPRSAAVIERCDEMTPEMWERLHGAVRELVLAPGAALGGPDGRPGGDEPNGPGPGRAGRSEPDPAGETSGGVAWWDPEADAAVDPWSDSVLVRGVEVKKGSAVRLAPSHRSDAQDIFLKGLRATVAGVFTDVDGTRHVAVTVDDDPATDELVWQGRYLFFSPDEVEPHAERPGAT